ncbi:hypothetical protein A3742_01355 [Oleiphilus sp. HI0071]|nr:marine proteobacterial sortase target protein [Oleiphilus sp. HI0080]KZY74894.1 hypothetical protein A3737_01105 [Oleiphilus sp. HI0065]KZY82023.1 hypothetical protein A3742_01355 [Oleiphilus sp. HI0071]KZY91153.1 hypothetical protein A3744_04610 [Oleiphilus sp. HI0073]KZZ42175.1 hypothetical protein A3758_06255 [Oleiphilus sp. HI0118]KZZ60378.1 hypothetical protein A3760_05815 [Oleiphilus sp. HI0122]KZZ64818.1 hypothetical protein A3765_06565 [Oleiphilus sp. HI0130]KZZ81980.1 hypothetica
MNSFAQIALKRRVLPQAAMAPTYAKDQTTPCSHNRRGSEYQSAMALFVCLLVFWVLCESALADAASDMPINFQLKHSEGEDSQELARPLALQTDIDLDINGPVVRATVKQRFENPSQHWVEGIYTFPLPEGAAVDQLRMMVGERVIEGQIREKREARKIYSSAKQQGKRAVLLEQPKGNFFTTRVANIAPQASVQIVFSYQTMLDFKDHGYSLRVPLVATPQYDPNARRGLPAFLSKEHQIAYRDIGEPDSNPVRLHMDLGAGMPVERIWSDSHTLHVDKQSDSHFQVTAGDSENRSNRDFVVNWRYAEKAYSQVSLFSEPVNGEYYNMLMLMPPAPSSSIEHGARELIFVLDVSGSMQGASIRQAKQAIRSALANLDSEDRFNILFFNDTAWSVFASSRKATSRNILEARSALDRQQADKGTEMTAALTLALTREDDALFRQVVFITDGAVSNEDALLGLIEKMLSTTRLFTVGIGSAPNSYFMRRAAEAGRGTFTYISDLSQVKQNIQRLFEKINHPALTDIDIALDIPFSDLMPNPTPDLYMNEAGYLLFKTPTRPSEMQIEAQHDDSPAYLQQRVGQTNSVKGIAVEWARQKIQHFTERALNTRLDDRDRFKSQATELALKHHQVSKYTSLVAVDVTPVRAGADLFSQKLRSNLPQGWQSGRSDSRVYHLAQTATSAPWMTQAGLVWLGIAMALLLITRLRVVQGAISRG